MPRTRFSHVPEKSKSMILTEIWRSANEGEGVSHLTAEIR